MLCFPSANRIRNCKAAVIEQSSAVDHKNENAGVGSQACRAGVGFFYPTPEVHLNHFIRCTPQEF